MRNALGLIQIRDPYGFTSDFNTSTWAKIGNQEYALVDEIKTAGNQKNSILIGRDGNYYLARKNQDGGLEAPKKITDLELLDEVLQNPKKYNNTIFDQLTAIHDDPTPFPTKNKVNYSIPAYGKFSQGGIMKLGYGDVIQSTNVTSSTKNTEDAKTDITKSHRLDGKDGSLTSAEKMQIGAALGDLAGVALSFTGPIGNVAGAATGLASTATRLVADIKHDGFQGKDA
jgi:hypothetical protein